MTVKRLQHSVAEFFFPDEVSDHFRPIQIFEKNYFNCFHGAKRRANNKYTSG